MIYDLVLNNSFESQTTVVAPKLDNFWQGAIKITINYKYFHPRQTVWLSPILIITSRMTGRVTQNPSDPWTIWRQPSYPICYRCRTERNMYEYMRPWSPLQFCSQTVNSSPTPSLETRNVPDMEQFVCLNPKRILRLRSTSISTSDVPRTWT